MKIIIDDLTLKPLIIRRVLSADDFGGDVVLLEDVGVDIEVLKSGPRVKISGRVSTKAELVCSRCLESFGFGVDAEYELLYLPAGDCFEEENARLKKDELSVIYYTEPVINLYDDIRQTIHLSIPFKPVCSESCLGLCPSCGVNLNLESCGCERAAVNPQFECLKNYFKTERNE
jgi:uncharacterized protein